MRILTVADFFYPEIVGGSAIMAYEVMQELVRRGHEVTVLTRGGQGAGGVEEVAGMEVHRYAFSPNPLAYPLSVLRAVNRIRSLGDKSRYDLINMHHASGGVAAEIYKVLGGKAPTAFFFQGPWHGEAMAKEVGAKKTGSEGGRLASQYALRRQVDRYILKNCDAVFCLSDYMFGEAVSIYSGLAHKYHRLTGGVDVRRFVPTNDKAAVRRSLDLPIGRTVLLTVRRLSARMGLENLVRAMAHLQRVREDVLLLIGGKGELQGRLQGLIEAEGLDNVQLLGFIDDELLPSYYQASDLFILPTETMEGFGLPTIEAMACGVPVLGTDTGATPEILRQILPDFIAVGKRPEELADDILRCLPLIAGATKDDQLRRFAEGHAWERVVDRVEEVFAGLIGGRGTPMGASRI
jgi:glycosyltransferase involved in cell wall biosynthesis